MTTNQKLAAEAREFQKAVRKQAASIKGAGSAAVHLGGGASPAMQRALLVALDSLLGAVVAAFDEQGAVALGVPSVRLRAVRGP